MDSNERLIIAMESMDTISNRLRELSNLLSTVHSGLMGENAEVQILDCIMCFLYTVNELHEYAEQTIRDLHAKEDSADLKT